jgi:glycosyltransferase involved in cell wall biosynthesis
MKILHICGIYIDDFHYQDQVLPRVQARMGHEVTVIAPIMIWAPYYAMTEEDFQKRSPYLVDGVKIVRLGQFFKVLNGRLAFMRGLYEAISAEEPNLIIHHNLQSMNTLTVLKYAKDNPGCNVIADLHSDFQNSGRNVFSRLLLHKMLWRSIIRMANRKVRKVLYVSPNVREFAMRIYGLMDEDLEQTYLGADMEVIEKMDKARIRDNVRRAIGLEEGDVLIVTAGKMDEKKKTHVLLDAVEKLEQDYLHVAVVGPVEKRYLEVLKRYQINVHFTGYLESKKVLEYFVSADLGVFPGKESSLWQEAICCGLPCIFRYFPGAEYLNPGNNARFLHSDEPEHLALIIQELLSDPDSLLSMGVSALEDGVSRFDYRAISEKMLKFAV